jgi:actin-related protein
MWRHRLEDSLVAQSAEVLFETPGLNVAEATLQSLALCDSYARECVSQHVVVSGGTSMLPGFGDRICEYLHEHGETDACVFPSTQYHESGYTSQRRHAAWIGGSILASLTAFNHLKITRAEWEENAEAVTRAKRF